MSQTAECSDYQTDFYLLFSFYGGHIDTSTYAPFLVIKLLAVPTDATIFYQQSSVASSVLSQNAIASGVAIRSTAKRKN